MKKVILLLSVIGAALLMTSCLDDGNSNYSEPSYVYITMDDMGQPYGKTFTGRLITHSSFISDIGKIKLMSYSWEEEFGRTQIKINDYIAEADNINVVQKVDFQHTSLNMSPLPEQDNPAGFVQIGTPIFTADKEFMNDYWVLEYAYKAKKGVEADVEFFKRAELSENGEIEIDIYLNLPSSDGTSQETLGGRVAFNMSSLRSQYSGGNDAKNELKIVFHYYQREETKEDGKVKVEVKPATLPTTAWRIGSAQ